MPDNRTWEKKSKEAPLTVALITDIGNDLMCGVSADTLIKSLDIILDEILNWDAEIFLTPININPKKDISQMIFFVLRFFYPSSKVNYEEIDLSIFKVNEFLEKKVRENEKMHMIIGLEAFAGLDRIHCSLFKTHTAWSTIAKNFFRVINVPALKKLRLIDAIKSIFSNLKRLIFCDMFFLKKKGREFF